MSEDRPGAWTVRDTLSASAVVLVLAPLLLRAVQPVSTLPGWELDPLVLPVVASGLGPGGSMLVDAVGLLGAALAIAVAGVGRREAALALLGAVPILWHGWLKPGGPSLHDQRIGLAWAAGMIGAVGLRALAGDRRWRAVILGVLIGAVGAMAVRAGVQAFIEHPATVAEFQRHREQIFAAQGWSPESSMAKAYERRLMQNDASAWFGLSNVLASVSAAAVVASAGLALSGWKRAGAMGRSGLALAVGAAALALALTQSKGGVGTLVVGLAAAGSLAVVRRGGWIGPAFIALALAGVIARGFVGERLGELSIYFRWFYVTAAAKIGAHAPWLGVGPDGFKDAFLLAKDPLCPEEVASPHSVFFDWWACLGLGGLAWAALLVAWSARVGAVAHDEPGEGDRPPATRALVRVAVAVPVVVTLAAAVMEGESFGPANAAVRLGGLVLWSVVAGAVTVAVLRGAGRLVGVALAGSAVALLTHAQIELTIAWTLSGGMVLAWVAVASARGPGRPAGPRGGLVVAPVVVLLALGAGVTTARTVAWERGLLAAAREAEVFPNLARVAGGEVSMSEARRLADRDSTWADAASMLDAARGNGQSAPAAAREAQARLLEAAAAGLARAEAITPRLFTLDREISRLNLIGAQLAEARRRAGEPDQETRRDNLLAEAARWADRPRRSASAAVWRQAVHETGWRLTGQPAAGRAALEAGLEAGTLDPTNPMHPAKAARLAAELGQTGDREAGALAAGLAAKSLALDGFARLDRLVRGLSGDERAVLEGLARAASTPPGPSSAGPTNP